MLVMLSLCSLVGCAPDDLEPLPDCDHGAAYIEGKRGYALANEATEALVDHDVLHLCAGVHPTLRLRAPSYDTRYVVEGEGSDSTIIQADSGASAVDLEEGEITVRYATITGGAGSQECESVDCSDYDCGSICGPEYGGGVVVNGATVVLDEVVIEGNSATMGGGIASASDVKYSGASIEIRNSRVVANAADKGGALAILTGTDFVSEDTDWGTGPDDNLGGDVAIIPGGNAPEGTRRARLSMDYEGVSSFRCFLSNGWEEYSCE